MLSPEREGPGLDVLDRGESAAAAGEANVRSVGTHGGGDIDSERIAKGVAGNRVG